MVATPVYFLSGRPATPLFGSSTELAFDERCCCGGGDATCVDITAPYDAPNTNHIDYFDTYDSTDELYNNGYFVARDYGSGSLRWIPDRANSWITGRDLSSGAGDCYLARRHNVGTVGTWHAEFAVRVLQWPGYHGHTLALRIGYDQPAGLGFLQYEPVLSFWLSGGPTFGEFYGTGMSESITGTIAFNSMGIRVWQSGAYDYYDGERWYSAKILTAVYSLLGTQVEPIEIYTTMRDTYCNVVCCLETTLGYNAKCDNWRSYAGTSAL